MQIYSFIQNDKLKYTLLRLNASDESRTVEAKKGYAIDRSIMETVCAFSNEPEMGGGYLLLGVEQEQESLFSQYVATGVGDVDKLQLNLSTQCASMFNQPIRPEITPEQISGKTVLKIYVPEIPLSQKPVYFKNEGLPRGAYRRIGSSDQRCTDDDLFVFYNKEDSFDSSIVSATNWDDVSEEAVALYRNMRAKVNPYAEELQYDDTDLLQSLGCLRREGGSIKLTYAGLLVFGKRASHRRLLPMVRVDYIRVPGNEWVSDPENRFTTVDMRGSLLEILQRVISVITDDLPKGFILPEGDLQAGHVGLPSRVLREALVNALIHRTYRENQPIQVIRFGNRLEIKNPGFSLKLEDYLGEPGSKNRNPYIAAIFHETNLAETKGSGIRTMRTLMERANLLPPTFESDHARNQFTVRLLLHHFLGVEAIVWLASFDVFGLNEEQKRALIFVKEVGAIDNASYRQLNGVDTLRASVELRLLRDKDLLLQKGKSRATYYVPGVVLQQAIAGLSTPPPGLSTPPPGLSAPPPGLSAPPPGLSAPPPDDTAPVDETLLASLPKMLQGKIEALPERINDSQMLRGLILELCDWRPLKAAELSGIIGRSEKYLLRNFIAPLREAEALEYLHPEMPNHPEQAYRTTNKTSI